MGVHVPRTRPPYPPEFRAEAVRLLRSTGRTPQQIADDLGVSRQSVANWARQADLDDGRRDDGLTTAEREELRRLRREVRELREEREILKKAAQYTSLAFGRRLREAGLGASMGSVGDCYDNAVTESFFATLQCELLDRTRFATRTQARTAVFDYLEGFYNPRRRHSTLGYLSPADFERRHALSYPAA